MTTQTGAFNALPLVPPMSPTPLSPTTVNMATYSLGRTVLGKGEFSKVYAFDGQFPPSNNKFFSYRDPVSESDSKTGKTSLKTTRVVKKMLLQDIDLRLLELNILMSVRHPYLMAANEFAFDMRTNPAILSIIMPRGDKGSINSVYPCTIEDTLKFLYQAGSALLGLHELGWLHLDVKPANILITADKTEARLIDCGISVFQGEASTVATVHDRISPFYRAPECKDQKGKSKNVFTTGADVWSFGVTILEVLMGGLHNISKYKLESIEALKQCCAHGSHLGGPIQQELIELLSQIFVSLESRLSLDKVLEAPLFKRRSTNYVHQRAVVITHKLLPAPKALWAVTNKNICLLLKLCQNDCTSVETFFFTVDLINRTRPYCLEAETSYVWTTHPNYCLPIYYMACYWIALEIMSQRCYEAQKRKYEEPIIKQTQCHITALLGGRLYRPYLYKACRNGQELLLACSTFLMHQENYPTVAPEQLPALLETMVKNSLVIPNGASPLSKAEIDIFKFVP